MVLAAGLVTVNRSLVNQLLEGTLYRCSYATITIIHRRCSRLAFFSAPLAIVSATFLRLS